MFDDTVVFIQKLEKILNIKLFLVGGAVRDLLLHRPTKDFDFTTPLSPDEIENKIRSAGFKPYLMGKRFGTIGFKFESKYIEITTFRDESYTTGSRKPSVSFHQDIRLDLARRDFTINAMAIDSGGDLIDFFNGKNDLQNKLIKCVGDPDLRFQEDALRILRAIRFAGEYEFILDQKTKESIQSNCWRLLDISIERWVLELDKILTIFKPDYAMDLLLDLGVFNIIFPEVNLLNLPFWQEYLGGMTHGFSPDLSAGGFFWAELKNKICKTNNLYLNDRWGILLSEIVKPMILSQLMYEYKFEQDKTQVVKRWLDWQNSEWFVRLQVQLAYKTALYLKFSKKRMEEIEKFIKSYTTYTTK